MPSSQVSSGPGGEASNFSMVVQNTRQHVGHCTKIARGTGTVLVVSSPPTIICAQNVMSFRALFPNGRKQRNLRSVLHLKPSVMQGLRVVLLWCFCSFLWDMCFFFMNLLF